MEPDGAGPGRGMPPDQSSTSRTWVHPSELGLHSRTRTDRRRGIWLSAGLVLGGVSLLLLGVAMGIGSSERGPARPDALDAITASLAQVTIVRGGERRTATGVLLDDGHVAVSADSLTGADEVWVTCAGRDARRATRIATDARTSLSVVTVVEGDSRSVIEDRAAATGDVVLVARAGLGEAAPSIEQARVDSTDTVAGGSDGPGSSTATSLGDSDGRDVAVVLVRISTTSGASRSSTVASSIRPVATSAGSTGTGGTSAPQRVDLDGAAFDSRGRFVGLVVRGDGTHRELLAAPSIMQLAPTLAR